MLSRPNPVGRRLFWTSIHLLVRVTDWARNAARATLLVGVALVCSAVWFVSTSSAHVWTINGWDRLFGSREELQAIDASGMPLPQTHCGSSTTVNLLTFDEPSAPTSAAEGTIGSSINASGETAVVYSSQADYFQGFIQTASGTFTSFDAPYAVSNPPSGTAQKTFPLADTARTTTPFRNVAACACRSVQSKENIA